MQMDNPPLTGASAPPPPLHEPVTNAGEKNDACRELFVNTWRRKGAPGLQRKTFKEIMFNFFQALGLITVDLK